MKEKKLIALALAVIMLVAAGTACSKSKTVEIPALGYVGDRDVVEIDLSLEMVPLTASPAMFGVAAPSAPGTLTKSNSKAVIDYSNSRDGYVMVKYVTPTSKQLKVLIKGPSGVQYNYNLRGDGNYDVFPFSDGNGEYTIGVYEQIEGTRYSTSNTLTLTVTLSDEFAPFLRSNQYVNFANSTTTVAKAAELVADKTELMAKISAIYNYVISTLKYDRELAANVKTGYLPDVDAVLERGMGICFDYAAVMASMLRSQDIPTKLVIGYAGTVYHAWIDVYSEEAGWINSIIIFDGSTWKLMDPTYAATANQSSEVMRYIGDGSNYNAMYLY